MKKIRTSRANIIRVAKCDAEALKFVANMQSEIDFLQGVINNIFLLTQFPNHVALKEHDDPKIDTIFREIKKLQR